MRPKIFLKVLVIVGVIFFTGRLVSHVSLFFAENQDRAIKTRCLKASYWFFPLDYFSAYKYAFGWLEQGFNKKDNKMLEKSIHWFKKSIRQNPFFHLSHHHLGKAYLFHDYPHSEFFAEGVKEIKRAVEIYQNNKIMVRDTAEILLSMWPLLSEADKELSRVLLLKYMSRFSWEEFEPLVELWWLYSREISFMETLLEKNPGFLSPVARLLIQLEGPLNLRWTFLAGYETHMLNRVIRKYRHGPSGNEFPLEFELSLLDELREIKGYDNFTNNKKFNQERFQKHKILLINKRIQNLIYQYPENMTLAIKDEIGRLITEYIEVEPELKDLLELENFLNRKGFFKANDFGSLYLKFRIKFSQSGFSDMIDEIETLRRAISFVKDNHRSDYVNILLLLSDAYESSKLLTVADTTLRDILKISPDNPDAWLRLVHIQQVLGDDDLKKQGMFREQVDRLKQSRFLSVDKPKEVFFVFLIDKKEIEISVDPGLINQLRDKKIIQVFIDGRIRYEEYISSLPSPIVIDLKEREEMVKVKVEVKFL